MLLAPLTAVASASTVTLSVDPAYVGQPPVDGYFEFDFSFGSQLNGTTLSGQSMSLDFMFADDILARVFGNESEYSLIALLMIETDANTVPGYAGASSTGYMLGSDGGALHAPLDPAWVGRASSDSGMFSVGLFPQLGNFDMAGVHYDLTLPTSGFAVTGGRVRLASNHPSQSIQMGTAVQLPEPATLTLLGMGLMVSAVARRRLKKRASHEAPTS